MRVTAIIAAGGRGRRLGASLPKQLLRIGGRTILQRSVDAFDACARVGRIVAVLPADLVAAGPDGSHVECRHTDLAVVAGGARRQDSVANGFGEVEQDADIVVVHDAARPFVSGALIDATIDAAAAAGASVAGIVASDTVKRVRRAESTADLEVASTLPRETIVLAQTPQAFRRAVLADALAHAAADREATDEAMLAERAGHVVRIVEGDRRNIKITTEDDLRTAMHLLDGQGGQATLRSGLGYDIHRTAPDRRLWLGGVEIAEGPGLLGHSDADVITHAIADAILGAAGAGDIGRHFPDTDPQWRDASSVDLLRRVVAIVAADGCTVENVDAVLIADRPKVAAYVETMRQVLSSALSVSTDRVSIKATTSEGVGPVGRGEAMAAQAVALVRRAESS